MEHQTRRALEAEVARRVLDTEDARLFKMVRDGKTYRSIALLYKKYEGENGVREAYERAQAKVHEAINSRQAEPEGDWRDRLRDPEDDETHSGLPVRVVPAGTLSGAAAAPASHAPPPTTPRQPSRAVQPPETSPPAPEPPARARRVPRAEREDQVCAALEAGPLTSLELARVLDTTQSVLWNLLPRMRDDEKIKRVGTTGRSKSVPIYALPDYVPAAAYENPLPAPAAESIDTGADERAVTTALAPTTPRVEAAPDELAAMLAEPPPPPFAGVTGFRVSIENRVERDVYSNATERAEWRAARERYVNTLIDRLAAMPAHDSPMELCDRIEQALGMNGSAEQHQALPTGARERG